MSNRVPTQDSRARVCVSAEEIPLESMYKSICEKSHSLHTSKEGTTAGWAGQADKPPQYTATLAAHLTPHVGHEDRARLLVAPLQPQRL